MYFDFEKLDVYQVRAHPVVSADDFADEVRLTRNPHAR